MPQLAEKCQILKPLSEVRDQTCHLVIPSPIRFCPAMTGIPSCVLLGHGCFQLHRIPPRAHVTSGMWRVGGGGQGFVPLQSCLEKSRVQRFTFQIQKLNPQPVPSHETDLPAQENQRSWLEPVINPRSESRALLLREDFEVSGSKDPPGHLEMSPMCAGRHEDEKGLKRGRGW